MSTTLQRFHSLKPLTACHIVPEGAHMRPPARTLVYGVRPEITGEVDPRTPADADFCGFKAAFKTDLRSSLDQLNTII